MSEINPEELELDLADRALEEAMALLANVRFSVSRGAYRQGELTAVSVMLEEDSEAGVHHIRVMCHDPGHLGIDWDGLPLTLIERPSGKNWLGFLDARGRAEFVVAVSAESDLGFGELNPNGLAKVEVPSSLVTGHAEIVGAPRIWQVSGLSRDGSLSALAERKGVQGNIWITVRADVDKFPALRNGEVQVVLRSNWSRSVWLQARIGLNLRGGSEGHWEGRVKVPHSEFENRPADATLLVFAAQRE
jgi:hypothetical protein